MSARKTSNAGFTLSELLLAVAIIGILAAIAIPSIVSAQNNMRMVELNNAAESIANAAQAQMTAKKVSGTWIDLVKDGETFRSDYPQARTQDEASNRRYMTADTARANGVVPSLSIDDAVRDGDYVIEFDASTASVISVFYTDGKSGFFGKADPSTQAARSYYASGGSTDQQARMKNPIMIGYYEGTPAGATPEAALANPVIWVDAKTGCLMVQDPNIAKGTGTTTSTVTIVNTSKNVSFVLSSLSNRTTLMSVATADSGVTYALSGTVLSRVLNQVDRDGAESTQANVFSLDLNALSSAIPSSGYDALKAVFAQCSSGDRLTVDVETKDTAKNCVPATASANVEWPAPVGKLTFMITNPYSAAVAEGKANGSGAADPQSYKSPSVDITTPSGSVVKDISVTEASEDTTNYFRQTTNTEKRVVPELTKQNEQAGYQSYTGAWVATGDVVGDSSFRFKATVGEYGTHTYQIWELWVKQSSGDKSGELMRIGYLKNNKWEWASFTQNGKNYDYGILSDCFTWYGKDGSEYKDITGLDTDALNIVSVSFNVEKYFQAAANAPSYYGLADEDRNATIYVRTAPKVSEVQEYFQNLADDSKLASTYLTGRQTTQTSSRTVNDASAEARRAFEATFGASSSDVSWNVVNETTCGSSLGEAFLKSRKSVRVYYTIAPAVGFKNIRDYGNGTQCLRDVRSTSITNAFLWLYQGESLYSLSFLPAAALDLIDNNNRYVFRQINNSSDFKMTTLEDYRFYRVLSYETSGQTAPALQYVPRIASFDPSVATIPAADNYSDSEYVYTFTNWVTNDTTTGKALSVEAGSLVGDYPALSEKGATLTAVYNKQSKGVGLMYLEFAEEETFTGTVTPTGYYGYASDSDNASPIQSLPTTETVGSWDYYVVVPEGYTNVSANGNLKLENKPIVVNIGGSVYQAYRIVVDKDEYRLQNQDVKYMAKPATGGMIHCEYTVNFNFAAAVAKGKNADPQSVSTTDANGNTVSAWNVRHADQFIGSLRAKENHKRQDTIASYLGDSFLQTCDIDMAARDVQNGIFPNNSEKSVFRGVYDGGGFSILNIHKNWIESRRVEVPGQSNRRGSSLLFPRVNGSPDDPACIKNIHIKENFDEFDNSTFRWAWRSLNQDDTNTVVGLLAGYVSNAVVENCSIEGISSNDTVPTMEISHKSGSIQGWGVLIGRASDAKLVNLAATGLRVVAVENSNKKLWGGSVAMAGIVGIADNTSILQCFVSDVGVGTTIRASKNAAYSKFVEYAGGIVGNYTGDEIVSDSRVEDTTLVVAEGQVQFGDTLEVGALVGNAAGKTLIGDGCSARNVFVEQGDTIVLVEEFLATLQVDAPVNARKEEAVAEPEAAAEPVEPTNETPTIQEPVPAETPVPPAEDGAKEDSSATESPEKVDPHA